MDIVTDIENDQIYDSVRLKLRQKESGDSVTDDLKSKGLSSLQSESILNTSRLIKSASINSAVVLMILCSLFATIGTVGFVLIPSHSGAGFLNYFLFSIMIITPLLISHAVNTGFFSLDLKRHQNKLYIGYMVYLFAMVGYLMYYKFAQDRHIWEALIFILIAIDFKNLFDASNETKYEDPQFHLEIKAYQGEQKKYKVFKRITFTSSLILLYMMLISSHTAVAGLSFIPFGLIIISMYWVIMSLVELNNYRQLF